MYSPPRTTAGWGTQTPTYPPPSHRATRWWARSPDYRATLMRPRNGLSSGRTIGKSSEMALSRTDATDDGRIISHRAQSGRPDVNSGRIPAASTHNGAAALLGRRADPLCDNVPPCDADRDDALVRKRTANANRAGVDEADANEADHDTTRHGRSPIVRTGLMFLYRERSPQGFGE